VYWRGIFEAQIIFLKKPLTRPIYFARIKNCSARQSAYRAGGGKTSKADK
jgi:hypothetical protein